jgi:hypothetical protein
MIVRAATMAALLAVGATGCAAIWGFQDALDLPDGSGAPQSGSDGAAADANVGVDANTDATGESSTETSFPEAGAAEAGAAETAVAEAASTDASAAEVGAAESGAPDANAAEASAESGATDAGSDAQPACTTVCIPPPTSPWTGPYVLLVTTGMPAPAVPTCSSAGAFPVDAYDGVSAPSAPTATCTCNCGPVSGATCSAPVATFFNDFGCTRGCGAPSSAIGACMPLPGCNFWQLAGSTAQGGSCTPSATRSVTPAVWTTSARLCGASSPPPTSGCGGGAVCVGQGNVPPSTGYCVARAGTGYSCPAGYPVAKTYYSSGTDTRDCTTCSCANPTGASCSGGAGAASRDPTCFRNNVPLTAPRACNGDIQNLQSAMFTPATPSGGSCAPLGGQATGTFIPTSPMSVCCTQ